MASAYCLWLPRVTQVSDWVAILRDALRGGGADYLDAPGWLPGDGAPRCAPGKSPGQERRVPMSCERR